jgi:signal transduction histidine kinase
MAIGARAIRADNTAARLPVAPSGDELEELGQAFNGLLDELFAAYERQRRFAGDAAHQLRTPLTVLQGQVEVALRRTRTPEEYAATLGIVKQEVAAFSETVETLLALARPQAEGAPSDLQLLEFPGWLEDYLLKWKTHPRAGDLRLESERQSGRTSPRLLAQLLDVLVSNALKYSTAGSPIVIRSKGASGGVELFVEDQGMGIAAGDQKAIFEPFFRAPQARQSGTAGTGLGLAIAARIAAALGGTLSCSSELGQGSRFRLTLPQAI